MRLHPFTTFIICMAHYCKALSLVEAEAGPRLSIAELPAALYEEIRNGQRSVHFRPHDGVQPTYDANYAALQPVLHDGTAPK